MSDPGRLPKPLRWLAPSVVAACLGAAVAGLVEGVLGDLGLLGAPASAGFASILAVPVCFALALVARGLWAAWRPHHLAPLLLEEDGGAPRLAAWLLFLAVAAFYLSWATFNGVRLIAKATTFKANVVSLIVPVIVVANALVLAAVSRPAVDVVAWMFRRLGVPRAFAPRVILAVAIGVGSALALFAWFVTLKPRLGGLDGGILVHPVIAVAVTAAVHPVWRRLAPRARLLALTVPTAALTVATAAAALWVRFERPSLMLAIWAQPSVGGLAIDTVYDVEHVRDRAMMEKYQPVPREGAPRRSIVLVTIDTVRHDHTPLGGGSATMPTLATLGRRGVVFERAVSPSNTTRRSIPALILGQSPARVRGRVVGWALKLDPRHVTLAERLKAAGYTTAGFFCCDNFWDPSKKTGYSRGIDEVFIDPDGEVIGEEARQWIVEHGKDQARYFLWLHFLEPHSWAKLRAGKGEPAASTAGDGRTRRYNRALAEVDDDLAGLAAAIDALPEDRKPLVVITSDHGEALGEHGVLHHSSNLYESQIHVPLVIVGPGLAPRRIREPVGGIDLAPTLLDLAGFVPPGMPDMDGRSLADLATGARPDDPDGGYGYAVMIKDRSTPKAARAITRGKWKLIESARGLELYDVLADPREEVDRAGSEPDIVDELKALLDERAVIDATPPF